MDSLLLEDNEFYLAENCVRSFTTPALIPAIVFRYGCLHMQNWTRIYTNRVVLSLGF